MMVLAICWVRLRVFPQSYQIDIINFIPNMYKYIYIIALHFEIV